LFCGGVFSIQKKYFLIQLIQMKNSWLETIIQTRACYTGAFLDEEEKVKILKQFPPSFQNIFTDHLTIKYKPSQEEMSDLALGEKVLLTAVALAKDEKAEALLIQTDISANSHPHITISTAPGIEPSYSNQLLEKANFKEIPPFDINARIGLSAGKKIFFEEPDFIFKKIILPTRPQADTLVAIYILRKFGNSFFKNIDKAEIEIAPTLPAGKDVQTLEDEGVLAIDIGGGKFDHHGREPKITASELIADYLGMRNNPALSKLIEYARRDDIHGQGTISNDPLDRAFGLSGLIVALNKDKSVKPEKISEMISPLLDAHYKEELRRTEELPREFEQKTKEGRVEIFQVKQRDKKLKVVIVDSDNPSLPGFLRSQIGGRFDVVAQKHSSGHINILTRPTKRVDLRSLIGLIRKSEAMVKGVDLAVSMNELSRSGRLEAVPEWYYDPATNSIQNGGINPKDILSTKISKEQLKKIIELGLSESLWSPLR